MLEYHLRNPPNEFVGSFVVIEVYVTPLVPAFAGDRAGKKLEGRAFPRHRFYYTDGIALLTEAGRAIRGRSPPPGPDGLVS